MTDRLTLERTYWDEAALDPDVDQKYISDISTDQMIEALEEIPDDAEVLDIGCGVGRISGELGKSYDLYGIDISTQMLNIASERTVHASYILCDGRTIPFDPDSFDFVYSMLLFQHLEGLTIYGYMQETFRVLRPGGIFRFQYIPGTEQEPFSRHYDTKQIRKWLKLSGLEFIKEDKGLCHPQWNWITARKTQA